MLLNQYSIICPHCGKEIIRAHSVGQTPTTPEEPKPGMPDIPTASLNKKQLDEIVDDVQSFFDTIDSIREEHRNAAVPSIASKMLSEMLEGSDERCDIDDDEDEDDEEICICTPAPYKLVKFSPVCAYILKSVLEAQRNDTLYDKDPIIDYKGLVKVFTPYILGNVKHIRFSFRTLINQDTYDSELTYMAIDHEGDAIYLHTGDEDGINRACSCITGAHLKQIPGAMFAFAEFDRQAQDVY